MESLLLSCGALSSPTTCRFNPAHRRVRLEPTTFGLTVVWHGDLRLPVQVATADTLAGSFDTVLLTAKAYDLIGNMAEVSISIRVR